MAKISDIILSFQLNAIPSTRFSCVMWKLNEAIRGQVWGLSRILKDRGWSASFLAWPHNTHTHWAALPTKKRRQVELYPLYRISQLTNITLRPPGLTDATKSVQLFFPSLLFCEWTAYGNVGWIISFRFLDDTFCYRITFVVKFSFILVWKTFFYSFKCLHQFYAT